MADVILGLAGKARSGKDTIARVLVEEHGYARLAFADALKELALALDPIVIPGSEFGAHGRLGQLVESVGMDRAKETPEVRRLLQALGDGGRRVLGGDPWINELERRLVDIPGPVVITDVRYVNEVFSIHDLGGAVARVVRPGRPGLRGELANHPSETELDDFDLPLLSNYGDLDTVPALAREADRLARLASRLVA